MTERIFADGSGRELLKGSILKGPGKRVSAGKGVPFRELLSMPWNGSIRRG
jgi:hypothetical protein